MVNVICELEALPKVGNVVGAVSDGESGQPVIGAKITVTDPLNRSLDLSADSAGSFSVGNVKPGTVKLTVEGSCQPDERDRSAGRVTQRGASAHRAVKRLTVLNVVVAGHEVKLKKEVHFQHDSDRKCRPTRSNT